MLVSIFLKLNYYYWYYLKPSELEISVISQWTVMSNFEWKKRVLNAKYVTKDWRPRPAINLNKLKVNPNFFEDNYQISVLISLHGSNNILPTFLNNIYEQTIFLKSEFNFVVCCAPLRELQFLDIFCSKFQNCKLLMPDKHISVYEAWNIGLNNINSPLITNMNSDDLRSKESLEFQVLFMQENPKVDIAFQDFYLVRDFFSSWETIINISEKVDVGNVNIFNLAWKGINSPHHAPVWRRTMHSELGLFDTSFKSAADYEFWLRALHANKQFRKILNSQVGYYLNPNGVSTKTNSFGYSESSIIQEKYKRLFLNKLQMKNQLSEMENLILIEKLLESYEQN
jgi:hypothetical protein